MTVTAKMVFSCCALVFLQHKGNFCPDSVFVGKKISELPALNESLRDLLDGIQVLK